MMISPSENLLPGVLVSDFDGTMTRQDFYKLAVERFLPPDFPNYMQQYRDGKISHFEALRLYFESLRADESELLAITPMMGLEPALKATVQELRQSGWRVVVTSAGCDWYIRHLLVEAGVDLEVHANPGHVEPGGGLVMERPQTSPYVSDEFGIDKAGAVRTNQQNGHVVAFAGDSRTDAEAARLVPPDLRFARDDLAKLLDEEGLAYHPFERWSEVAQTLISARLFGPQDTSRTPSQ